jgi:hypothetical protein
MRVAKLENYNNDSLIETYKIQEISKIQRHTRLLTDKDKKKVIKKIEQVVRSSQEYKHYIEFLKREIDMTQCSFFTGITTKDARRVSLEIHHEPFTLFDITQTVMQKWINEEREINPIMIAEEIMKLHYQNKIGLIPLSVTVHQLVHRGNIFIPLQNVYGDFIAFLQEYEIHVTADLKEILEVKLRMSRDITNQDLSILGKKYTYLEIDGMKFPEPIEIY